MTTLGKYYVVITLGLTVFLMGVIGFWTFWPVDVMTIKNSQSIKLDKTVYQAGDRITYTLEYCKHKNYPGTVMRSLVNSIRINFTPYYNNIPVGCGTFNNSELVIPEFVDSGTYHIETTIEYKINPLKTVLNTWKSVEFKVERQTETDQVNKNTEDIKDLKNFDN